MILESRGQVPSSENILKDENIPASVAVPSMAFAKASLAALRGQPAIKKDGDL